MFEELCNSYGPKRRQVGSRVGISKQSFNPLLICGALLLVVSCTPDVSSGPSALEQGLVVEGELLDVLLTLEGGVEHARFGRSIAGGGDGCDGSGCLSRPCLRMEAMLL